MRFKYTFEVNGRIKPTQVYSFQVNDFLFEFSMEDDFLREIVVSFPICEYELPLLNEGAQTGTNFHLSITSPRLSEVEEVMRQLEGIISLWGLESINIKHPKYEWLPETDEEKQKLKVFAYSVTKAGIEDHEIPSVPFNLIASAVIASVMHKNHDVLMSFYRHGSREVELDNYIEAIYYFYFIIESYYAEGKNKNYAVKRALLESTEFVNNVKSVVSEKNLPAKIEKQFQQYYKNKSSEEIIKELVLMRGFLHHYSTKRKDNWHPDKQENYQVHAYFLQKLSLNLVHKILATEHLTPEVYAKYSEMMERGALGHPLSIRVDQ
jgi:hypothetical protein